ncbi:hypothetical protein [Archangium sp.]|uniref:hypothetical protein n=1 Tax=Archangium sp. TaxID=1872627 RepID=UPI00389A2514
MSQTDSQQMGSMQTPPGEPDSIFSAYTEEQRRSRFGLRFVLYPIVALLLLGLGKLVVNFEQEARPIRVDTPWGLRTVRLGMSPQEVSGILGQPVSKERRGNQECYQYGIPSIKVADFVLHIVCYEDGKLRDVSHKRYSSWVVTRDGAIAPAPLEYEELPPPDAAPPSAPNVAGKTEP